MLQYAGISLIQVYAPQQGRLVAERDAFLSEVQEVMDDAKYQNNIILCGDWNGHVGCERRNYELNLGIHSIGGRNEAGEKILEFAAINNLCIMNTFYQHRESHKWTWYRYNRQQQSYTQHSMINLFLTNNKTLFCDVNAIPSVSMDGDHRIVVAKIKIRKPKIRKCAPMKKYKLNKMDSDETRTTLKNVISEKLQQENEVEQGVEDMWGDFKRKMIEAADEVLGEKVAYR